MRNLVIDIGNTSIKVAVFDNQELIEVKRHNLAPINLSQIEKNYSTPIIISHSGDEALINSEGFSNILYFSHETPIQIQLNYKTPETLGLDRIAGVVGAREEDQNVLVVDFGTCVTYDLIDRQGIYQGGFILPGIEMRLKSMHNFTARLPFIENWRSLWKESNGIGKSTYECMLNGVKESMHMEILQMLHQFEKDYSDLKVIYTGGDAQYFDKEIKNSIFAVPELVLKGLNKILLYNI